MPKTTTAKSNSNSSNVSNANSAPNCRSDINIAYTPRAYFIASAKANSAQNKPKKD